MTPLTDIKRKYARWVRLRSQADFVGDDLKKTVLEARKAGVSLQRIADSLNISRQAVHQWEKGVENGT